ncbi:MAG: M1 family metallopeptidase [Steroidobacteraceae bacterium]
MTTTTASRIAGCRRYLLILVAFAGLPWAAAPAATPATPATPAALAPPQPGRDYHTLANIDEFRVRHLELELQVLFEQQVLSGIADLTIERLAPDARQVRLDTRALTIRNVWWLRGPGDVVGLDFQKGEYDPALGSPLEIDLPAGIDTPTFKLRLSYQTRPEASGLQWVPPAQTAGKTHPYLYTQSQAINARSWIPLQDSPQVRFTYNATIHVPAGLRAVMSASNPLELAPDGVYQFEMSQPIPSYLLALGVGKLEFQAIGRRTGVFAEAPVLTAAAAEFADVEQMLETSEQLFGPYRWGRYDLLILPPSFPFGGMENPRLSFITPTVLAGDRSLVSLIAHELAHSWSGNLVTNATWRDLWLNEGFTVFLERRIVQALYGERRHDMEDTLGLQDLRADMADLPPADTRLAIDLRGRDPDTVFSNVPYDKGRLFLGWLEARFGRAAFDEFLRGYFDHFAFQSISTEQFRAWLDANLVAKQPAAVTAAEIDEWLYQPGLPRFAVLPQSPAFAEVDAARGEWLAGKRTAASLPGKDWTTHEWLHFLNKFPPRTPAVKLSELDAAFGLTQIGNNEIAHSWLRIAIRNSYEPAFARLAAYLETIGRRKLIKPLYEDLMKTPAGAALARDIYARARANYHPIAAATLDPIVFARAAGGG